MATLAPTNALTARANDDAALRRAILSTERDVVVEMAGGSAGLVRAVPMASLGAGSQAFMAQYGVQYPLYTGAMAKGIASAELVIAAGSRGMLASLGAGGLPIGRVTEALDRLWNAAMSKGGHDRHLSRQAFGIFHKLLLRVLA